MMVNHMPRHSIKTSIVIVASMKCGLLLLGYLLICLFAYLLISIFHLLNVICYSLISTCYLLITKCYLCRNASDTPQCP